MKTLEEMGYVKVHNYYKKQIGDYTINIYLTANTNEYIRKINKGPAMIDIKKVLGVQSIERDKIFEKITAQAPRSLKIEEEMLCGLEMEASKDVEVVLEPETKEVNVND